MQSYFFSALIATVIGNDAFTNSIYNTGWNFVDGFGSFPGIAANYKKNKSQWSALEKSLAAFEGMVASSLIITNVLSTIAQQDPDSFGSDNALMATLSSYGFALSMTASAIRAMKDTWTAWEELSPRYLLEDRLKKYREIVQEIASANETEREELKKEKIQLLKEALAIAKVKRHEILEDGETIKDIFTNMDKDFQLPESLDNPTAEETLFIETLLEDNKKKFKATFTNFLGYLSATLCFWPLALSLKPCSCGGCYTGQFWWCCTYVFNCGWTD